MKIPFVKTETTPDLIQEAIENLYRELNVHDAEEYDNITNQIVKLTELQNKLQLSKSWRPSPDALVSAVASITGVVLILNFEKLGIVTSKAMGFVGKMKN